MQSATTIPDLKTAFLAEQVRLLSAPIRLEPGWQARGRRRRGSSEEEDEEDERELRNSVVDDVLHKGEAIHAFPYAGSCRTFLHARFSF